MSPEASDNYLLQRTAPPPLNSALGGRTSAALTALKEHRAGGLIVLGSSMMFAERKQIGDLAAKRPLPSMGPFSAYAEAGGLMTYGADLRESFRRSATYVHKILKGANPGDLPVEQATKFQLIINLKTAKQIGLIIPQSVLQRADEVIQ